MHTRTNHVVNKFFFRHDFNHTFELKTAMTTIDEYLDSALLKLPHASDRQLCRELGLGLGTVSQWRTKRSWPSDKVIVQIAHLAGINELQALIDLNIWRTNGDIQQKYVLLDEKLKSQVNRNTAA